MVARALAVLCLSAWFFGCSSGEPDGAPAKQDKTPPSAGPAVKDQRLIGREWRLQSLGAVGEEKSLFPDTTITLIFNEDGTLDGLSGCNNYRTTYRAGAAGDLAVRAMVRTNKSCGFAIDRQETTYLDVLHRAESYEVHEDRLLVFYESGSRNLIFASATSSSPPEGSSQTPSS